MLSSPSQSVVSDVFSSKGVPTSYAPRPTYPLPVDPKELSAIKACQAGELGRFDDLYEMYAEKIYRFIYFKTFHKETAEDLTSEVFMKAIERMNQYDESKGAFGAWLYRVARNTVIDHYRTSHPSEDIDDGWDFASSSNVEQDAHANLQLEKVQEALKLLKPDQREVVIMRLWNGMSHQEIAQVLDLSESNCKQIFSRTIRQLREQLGDSILISLVLIGALLIK